MKFLRHLLGITQLDKEKNQCIRQKTGAQNIVKEIKQYQKKWLQHVQRMDTNRLPKQALQYKPKVRRNIGRPRKRWKDQLHLEDQGTVNTPSPSGTWCWWWDVIGRSGWPHGLRPVSAAAHLLGLWVRNPSGTWIFVCCRHHVFSGEGLWVGLTTCPEKSYRVWRVWVWSWRLDNEETLDHEGLLLHQKYICHGNEMRSKATFQNA